MSAIATILRAIAGGKPMRNPAFPWAGDLEACRAFYAEKQARIRSERTSKGNRTRAANRKGQGA